MTHHEKALHPNSFVVWNRLSGEALFNSTLINFVFKKDRQDHVMIVSS